MIRIYLYNGRDILFKKKKKKIKELNNNGLANLRR